jgi:hypothetical protein
MQNYVEELHINKIVIFKKNKTIRDLYYSWKARSLARLSNCLVIRR